MDFDTITADGNPVTTESGQPAFTMANPPRIGAKVRYRGGETHQTHGATSGIYTVHENDEYFICGYIEVRDALGRVFPIDANLLEALPGPISGNEG